MSRYILILVSLLMMQACSKSPAACEICEDEQLYTPCIEDHRQFQQGVLVDLENGEAELFDLTGIDQFYEVFLIETDLNKISENQVLISSAHGNYVLNTDTRSIIEILDSYDPVYGLPGSDKLYFQTDEIGSIEINDSTFVENVQTKSSVFEWDISTRGKRLVSQSVSRFLAADTLLIESMYFPFKVPGEIGYVVLYEAQKHYVSVSSTSNRVRRVYEYSERVWRHVDDQGSFLSDLSPREKVVSQTKPSRFTVTNNPLKVAYQVDDDVRITDLVSGDNYLLEKARSPQLSSDGKYVSITDFNEIEVFEIDSESRFQISDQSDYTFYNPSTFLENQEALIFVEKDHLNGSRYDAVVKRSQLNSSSTNAVGKIFQLTEHVETDSLDFWITRASQPVALSENEIFFLLFQHLLITCD